MASLIKHLFFAGLVLILPLKTGAESQLPEIGGGGYEVITEQQEYRLGRAWARMLRGSAKLYEDALVTQYLEDLTWNLATQSQLTDRRLEIVVLDNGSLNAFAVPGGIIGIHAGLLLAAETESELASVIAHELAHLSQRHFAAQLEEQRRNQPLLLVSLLGSILLAAADGEAGIVALQSSMAASVSSKLAFSRQNEREADFIGMQTLAASGYDPHAMPRMFSQLQKAARFSRTPPEFLLTHPVTQSRVSDSLNRAEQIKGQNGKINSRDYELIRTRIQVHYAKDKNKLLQKYLSAQQKKNSDSLKYAVTLAAIAVGNFSLAAENIAEFSEHFQTSLNAEILAAELAIAQGKYQQASEKLRQLRQLYPDNQAVAFMYAEVMISLNQPAQASLTYEALLENNPSDSRAWYMLAETYGLEGNIVGVHEARIEYFLLTANVDRALQQIDYALKEPGLSNSEKARLEQRKQDAKQVRKALEMNF